MRGDVTSTVARPRRPVDAGVLLLIWVGALMLIPANLVFSPLGAAGTPAQLIGLAAGGWWLAVQVDRARATLSPAPATRTAMTVYLVAVLLSYVAATTRPIEPDEISAADRGVLLALSWWGLVMLTADGLLTRKRLETVLRFLVVTAGAAATLGVAQYVTHQAFVDRIVIPGLSANQVLNSVYGRNGFARAAGTSTHPIEFGVMLAMVLPLALHFALNDQRRGRAARWWPVVAIAAALPITMSRSAIIGLAIVLIVLLPTWPVRRRWLTLAAVVGGFGAVYVAVPGMLGTMTRLFTGIAQDDSAKSRTDSYDLAWSFISQNPLIGRGVSTFLPSYRILDNQYLGSLIETGIVGTLALLGLLVTGMVMARRMSKHLPQQRDRSLARSLLACIAAATVACATFDAFGFPQVAGILFFALGCVAALGRVGSLPPDPEPDPAIRVRRSRFDATPPTRDGNSPVTAVSNDSSPQKAPR